jgi:hypothetical protein
MKKAKTISKTPKNEFRRIQKESERIRRIVNMMGVIESPSVNHTLNASQKTNKLQNVKLKQISNEI